MTTNQLPNFTRVLGLDKVQLPRVNGLLATAVALILLGSGLVSILPTSGSTPAELPESCDPMELRYEIPEAGAAISIPLGSGSWTVDWGYEVDGAPVITEGTAVASHTYPAASPGLTPTVKVCGTFTSYGGVTLNSHLVELVSWGDSADRLTSLPNAFRAASKLTQVPSTLPSKVTSLFYTFFEASNFNSNSVSNWDTSNVTNMSGTFSKASIFNQSLSSWDTSKVTSTEDMFNSASAFNQDLSSWDTSNVTSMARMFNVALNFNGNVSTWNTAKVTNMDALFASTSFNRPLISSGSVWDVSKVTSMSNMFRGIETFNQDLSSWDFSSVTKMDSMFRSTASFNQDLSSWDVSKVTTTAKMFERASAFNGSLAAWQTDSLVTMNDMFFHASAFNRPVGHFDISNIIPSTGMKMLFNGSGLSDANYGQTLIDWNAQQDKPVGVVLEAALASPSFGAPGAAAKVANCGAARSAWNELTGSPSNWSISDGTASSPSCPTDPDSVIVTAANTSENYGNSAPEVSFSVSGGYEDADWVGDISCRSVISLGGDEVSPGTPVGTYVNTCSGPDGSDVDLDISYVNGVFEVFQRPITITIRNKTAVTGRNYVLPSATTSGATSTAHYTISSGSLLAGDQLTMEYSTTATNPLQSGTYTLSGALTDSSTNRNYQATFVDGSLAVSSSSSGGGGSPDPNLLPRPTILLPAVAPISRLTDAQITGRGLGDIVRVQIGNKKAKLYKVTNRKIEFRIPRLLSGNHDIVLVAADGSSKVWQSKLRITGSVPSGPVTREFPGFKGGSSYISREMNRSMERFLRDNLFFFSTVRCIGMTDGPFIPELDGPLAENRAKAACRLAKSLGYQVTGRSSINANHFDPRLRKAIVTLGN